MHQTRIKSSSVQPKFYIPLHDNPTFDLDQKDRCEAAMAEHYLLNEEQIAEIRKAFQVCDEDGSGTIERDELSKVMKVLGESPTQDELEDIVKDLDKNGDGVISWEEFLGVMTDWIAEAELSDSDDETDSEEEGEELKM